MSDYTPTTDEINSVWRSRYDSQYHWAAGEELRGYEDEFDRWLEQVRAEAWDEGFADGVNHDLGDWENAPSIINNPYRKETEA